MRLWDSMLFYGTPISNPIDYDDDQYVNWNVAHNGFQHFDAASRYYTIKS